MREIRIEELIDQIRIQLRGIEERLDSIKELAKRAEQERATKEEKSATDAQLAYLKVLGYTPHRELSVREASLLISALQEVRKGQKG